MAKSISTTLKLNTGDPILIIGLGTYQSRSKNVKIVVKKALEFGYRHIDTATFYDNETEIGQAINETKIPCEEIFVTSKLWNSDHGYEQAKRAFARSISKLDLDYVDLYPIHWPVEGIRMESWRALEDLYYESSVKSIGVSN